jgi:hypothetical protein
VASFTSENLPQPPFHAAPSAEPTGLRADAGAADVSSLDADVERDSLESPHGGVSDGALEGLPDDGRLRFCLRCQEPLSYFNSGPWRCWKCDLPFDPHDAQSFLLWRTPLKWKFWFPGFCLSVLLGVLAYALLLPTREFAIPLLAAAPTCLGCLLGYGGRAWTRLFGLLAMCGVFSLIAVLGLAVEVARFGPEVLCMIFAANFILLIPAAIGMLAGVVLRATLENSNWDQRWYFP